jgi:polycomb group RING finger protein 3
VDQHAEADYHRQDEQVSFVFVPSVLQSTNKISKFQVNLQLECISNSLKNLNRRFVRCSSSATISHLKKFVATKLLAPEKYREVKEFNFHFCSQILIFF